MGGGGEGDVVGVVYCPVSLGMLVVTEGDEEMRRRWIVLREYRGSVWGLGSVWNV